MSNDVLAALNMSGDDSIDTSVDMDMLLNQSLDDIPDLPDFVTPREGAYRQRVDSVDLAAKVGEKRAIQITYSISTIMELKGSMLGDDVKPGDKWSELYFMTTPKGSAYTVAALKKLLMPVAQRMGTTNLQTTLQAFAGCEIAGLIVHQKDRDDKTKVYAKMKRIVFEN